jgi:3-oxoadipate enol-lactonase
MKAQVNGITINYEIEGPSGAPVVTLSHSLATTLYLWDPQVNELRTGSYRILRFDARGHGASSAPPGPYTMEMLASDLIALLDHLEIERTHFVGISMGGMIGQVLASSYPDRVESLVLCDTICRTPPEAFPAWDERIRIAETKGMAALAEATLERWLSEGFCRSHPEVVEHIRQMIISTPVPGFVGCGTAIRGFDITTKLNNITAPTLLLVGENDSTTPYSAADFIRQQIRSAQRVLVLPEALHLGNIEAVKPFNKALLGFLEEVTQGAVNVER